MSAWVEGKIDLKCSLDVLKKAIINIMPEWEKYILTDPNGNLPMYRYDGQRDYNGKGGDNHAHLLIPGGGNPNAYPSTRTSDNDWGFKKSEDGKWEVIFADYGLDRAKKLEMEIKSEIALMKAKAISKIRGFNIISENQNENEKYIDIKIDTSMYAAISN
jgi:hypothetical protein